MINLGFLLEFNLTFVILYLLYHFVFKGYIDALLTRAYLLLIAPLSLLVATAELPLLPALELLPATDLNFNIAPSAVAHITEVGATMGMTDYLFIIYGIGVGVSLLYFLYALLQIAILTLRNPKNSAGIRFSHSRLGAAFSFFALIFVDKKYENSEELSQLIAHEKCHQKAFHSLDLLYGAVLCSLMWFNPAVWALFAALRFEHERQADRGVLRSGVEPMSYAKTLLDAEVGFAPVVSSSLSYQLTKNRIKMMTRKTSKFASLRALLVLPIIALCAVLFTLTPATAQSAKSAKVANPDNSLDSIVVTGFSRQSGKNPYFFIVGAKGEQIKAGYDVDINKLDPNDIESISVLKDEKAISAEYPGATDPSRGVIAITLKGGELSGDVVKFRLVNDSKNPYYVIDNAEGKQFKAGYDVDIDGIDPEDIESISVLKDEKAISAEYPGATDPSRGVIEITLKGDSAQTLPVMHAETMPKFQGGDITKFRSWVAQNVKYPPQAKSAGTEGRVVVSFVIELDGSVSNVAVVRGADKFLDAEAVRVVASSPKWTPGTNKGKAVRFTYTLPIDFKL